MVAIARAISFGARVLILNEPTSSLTETEVCVLFDVMRRLKSQRTAIVYISHRFEELYSVCDRVTILRNGRNIVTRSLTTLIDENGVALTLVSQISPHHFILIRNDARSRSVSDRKRLATASLTLRRSQFTIYESLTVSEFLVLNLLLDFRELVLICRIPDDSN